MKTHDPMLDYTVEKLKIGIKALQRLDTFRAYRDYAPEISQSIAHDIKAYQEYLFSLKDKGVKDGR